MVSFRSSFLAIPAGLLTLAAMAPASSAIAPAEQPSMATSATAAKPYTGTVTATVQKLKVSNANPTGYDRDLFKHWTDANGDCQDARQEVLFQESVIKASNTCSVEKGRWLSYYDKVTTKDPSSFDIDHMVPLAEAWRSGAKNWSSTTREHFANDLGDKRSLVAVTASSNRSKSDRDPAQWMPQANKCRYVKEWTAVKYRWNLTIDSAEKKKLLAVAKNCKNPSITVRRASVR